MRNEQQLEEAFATLAAAPHPTEEVYARIIKRTSPTSVRRRRLSFVLAAAIVAILALTIPNLVNQRTAVPADTRAYGNWNLIHRVDLPPDWEVTAQTVTADSESTNLRTPIGGGDNASIGCLVEVYGRGLGDPAASAERRTPVQVNGRPGFSTTPSDQTNGGVVWTYADDAWAQVSCGNGQADDLAIAERVRFEVTETRLPFRLRSLPDGYRIRSVIPPLLGGSPPVLGAVDIVSTDAERQPYLGVVISPGTTEIPPGIAGWESDTINGVPAVLSARDGRLCLNTRGHTLCVESGEGTPADLTKSLWPAGRRELLVSVAEDITIAKNLDDPGTWYDANTTLPR